MTIQENYPLLAHNTFGIEANARWFVEYSSREELQELLQSELLRTHPHLHIGAGSNLLFVADYQGVVLHSRIELIKVVQESESELYVKVGAGMVWDDFVAYCVEQGWGGVENLSAIPGEVGASAVQNIGAYGAEAKDVIVSVETVEVASSKVRTFSQMECNYGYRSSVFKQQLKGAYIVTSVIYKLSKRPIFDLSYGNLNDYMRGAVPTLQRVREAVTAIRDAKLPSPAVMGNAGSYFMNPIIPLSQYETLLGRFPDMPHYAVDGHRVKVPAGWLIDRCGWKGREHGGAAVHQNQCLVLVNKCGATASDIVELAQQIQESVENRYGITITPEVNYIGGEL